MPSRNGCVAWGTRWKAALSIRVETSRSSWGRLARRGFDCVMIGAGLRAPPLLLFEKIVNLIHEQAPGTKICFNSTPADTVEVVQRRV